LGGEEDIIQNQNLEGHCQLNGSLRGVCRLYPRNYEPTNFNDA